MTQFQQTVNIYNTLGIIGELAFDDGGMRAIGATVNSSGVTDNLFGNAYTFLDAATAQPSLNSTNGAIVQAGGTGLFAGIMCSPKQNALYGTSLNPLGATLALPDNSSAQFLQRGYVFVNLPGPANPGDLVTYDTSTGNLNSVPALAVFTGAISTTTLTVSAVAAGTIQVGQLITGANVTPGTYITALGTGLGGTGTYTVSVSQTAASGTISAASLPPAAFSATGSISGTTLTITAVASGELNVGDQISGTGILANTVITAYGTGAGGTGTYTVNQSQTVSSETITGPTNLFVPNAVVERYQADTLGGVSVIKLSN